MDRRVDSAQEMWALGAALGRVVGAGDVVGLVGDLGAGKTVFVKGMAAGLGHPRPVTSPTFTLLHVHEGGRLPLFHADLYRLERAEELEDVGLDDALRQDGVVAVEWADRFPGALSGDVLEVRLVVVSETGRRLTARAGGPRASALLAAWSAEAAGI